MIDELDVTLREGMKIVGTFHDYDELVASLKARASSLGINMDTLDYITGLTRGHSGKLLGDAQIKQLGRLSFGAMFWALALKGVLIVDEKTEAEVRAYWKPGQALLRRPKRLARLGETTIKRMLPAMASEMGRRGGKAKMRNMTPAQFRSHQRMAGKARARARLRRGIMEIANKSRRKD